MDRGSWCVCVHTTHTHTHTHTCVCVCVYKSICIWGFPGGSAGKNPPVNAGDTRDGHSIPGSEGSPGVTNGNLLQYLCLENTMDRMFSLYFKSLSTVVCLHLLRYMIHFTWLSMEHINSLAIAHNLCKMILTASSFFQGHRYGFILTSSSEATHCCCCCCCCC